MQICFLPRPGMWPSRFSWRWVLGKQLNYLKRDLAAIDGKLNQEKALNVHQTERLGTIRKIYEQQKYMYDNHTHSVENRIVSVSQPFVRPIVRGKAGKPVEFGMKLDISISNGWTRLEYHSFDAYNEATKLQAYLDEYCFRFNRRMTGNQIFLRLTRAVATSCSLRS